MKHTPGPWFYSGKHDTCEVRYVALSPDDHYEEIATLFGKDGAEQQANAHLIAAAPDLLELLQEIYFDLIQRAMPDAGDAWYAKALAAIAKATGE